MEKYKLKAILYKTGDLIYFSQLDIYRVLKRALRRTPLPVYFTQGFNPRPKISFYKGLKLGEEGEIIAVFYFYKDISPNEFKDYLQKELPSGLRIVFVSKADSNTLSKGHV